MNEVSYHVVLDLTPEEIKYLKVGAAQLGFKVKELVKQAVLNYVVVEVIKRSKEEKK